jgi:hypothetical protein
VKDAAKHDCRLISCYSGFSVRRRRRDQP